MYDYSSVAISLALLAVILILNEIGFRLGRRQHHTAGEGLATQTNAIQAAILGLLALLLGFTFSMALQRFDSRSQAAIEEANTIGTTLLRTELLPEPPRTRARDALRRYVDLRLRMSETDLTRRDERRALDDEVSALQSELWSEAIAAATADPRPVTSGLFVQSLNEMIDAYGRRMASLRRHVPEPVLLLLFAVFAMAGAILGYACGLTDGRPLFATVVMSVLIVLVVFLIVDLDRPRRGIIQVNQASLIELRDSMAR